MCSLNILQCSSSCGNGIERRVVKCLHSSGQFLDDSRCSQENRPAEERHCEMTPCLSAVVATNEVQNFAVMADWRTGRWTEVKNVKSM